MEDKLGVLRNLGGRADEVLIGGKMAEEIRESNPLEFEVVLPVDVVAAAAFEADTESKVVPYDELPDGWLGLDIGPETRRLFAERLARAKTVFWNGPMGVFEWPRFADGTKAVAEAVAGVDGYHGRRRRRLGARADGARARGSGVVGLDGRRRLPRAARGQGAARRRRDPGGVSGSATREGLSLGPASRGHCVRVKSVTILEADGPSRRLEGMLAPGLPGDGCPDGTTHSVGRCWTESPARRRISPC